MKNCDGRKVGLQQVTSPVDWTCSQVRRWMTQNNTYWFFRLTFLEILLGHPGALLWQQRCHLVDQLILRNSMSGAFLRTPSNGIAYSLQLLHCTTSTAPDRIVRHCDWSTWTQSESVATLCFLPMKWEANVGKERVKLINFKMNYLSNQWSNTRKYSPSQTSHSLGVCELRTGLRVLRLITPWDRRQGT